jgi:ankyrin repeat protein
MDQELRSKVAYQDIEGVEKLILSGADVNARDEMQGNTALILACSYGFTDIAKLLISNGADVNVHNTMYGTSPLIAAAFISEELVEILLANGADVHGKTNEGTTAFTSSILGVLGGYITTSVASLLLEKGADVNEATSSGPAEGYTCLMMAAVNNNPELVKFLLSKGADINAKAKDGTTAIGLAIKENDKDMVALLKKNGAKE